VKVKKKITEDYSGRIKAVLDHLGWSQKDLSEKMKMPQETISYWSTGSKEPRKSSLQKIAEVTGCNLTWLSSGEGGMFLKYKWETTDVPPREPSLEELEDRIRRLEVKERQPEYKHIDEETRLAAKTADRIMGGPMSWLEKRMAQIKRFAEGGGKPIGYIELTDDEYELVKAYRDEKREKDQDKKGKKSA